MSNSNTIEKSLKSWKILLAIFIGLSVTSWMVYRSVSETRFLKVENGKGNYQWVDANHNEKIDSHLAIEFQATTKGDFVKESMGQTLAQIDWTAHTFFCILLAMVFMVGRDFFYMLRIRTLTNEQLNWKQSFYVIMIWEFASALAPGVIGGVAVAMFIIQREKISLGRSTAIVVITAMLDNLFYVFMIPIILLMVGSEALFPSTSSSDLAIKYVFWIGFAVILFACVLLFTSIFIFPTLAKNLFTLVCKLPFLSRFREKAVKTGDDIQQASIELRGESVFFWLKAFGATCASWTCRYLVINALMAAVLPLSFVQHAIILSKQFVLWLFMHISPTPGGSGVAEFAFGELLSSFSASAILLTSLAILWRLISYFPYLFIGAILLPRWLRKTAVSVEKPI